MPANAADHLRPDHPSQDARWQQVLARDPLADGRFVYAVRSTKIYCRPTCPSRRPARANVDFFLNVADAEQAGFRACKRCRPNGPSAFADPHAALVAEAARRLAQWLPRQG